MMYHFLIKDLDGFSHPLERAYDDDVDAKLAAMSMCDDVNFVESVTLSRVVSDGSDDELEYIDDFCYS